MGDGTSPTEWHALIRAAAPRDLQVGQHWDNVAWHDSTDILQRPRAWTLERRELGWAAAKLVTGDVIPLADGTFEVRLERNGQIYKSEVVGTAGAARTRLLALREEMIAAGWVMLPTS